MILAAAALCALPALADDNTALAPVAAKPLPVLNYKDDMGIGRGFEAKSKLTAIHFWATWCVPCLKELAEVDAAAEKFAPKGFSVVAISMDGGNIEKVKDFLTDHHLSHITPYLDDNNASFKALALRGLPATIFVDQNGKEIGRAEGPIDWKGKDVVGFIEGGLK